jgi:signal transduction histidine kinase/CheY-like chemotaxis protein
MHRALRPFRSGLLWRGAMIVALFVALQSLLFKQRSVLIQQEAAFGHAVLDNAWSISELLNETKNTVARLAAHEAGRAGLDEVQLSYELLWSRIGALDFAEKIEFEGLVPLVDDYLAVLNRHEPIVFSGAPLETGQSLALVADLEDLSARTRRLWSVQFNENRGEFLGRVSGQISGTARDIDVLMALVALAGLAYLGLELFLSSIALRREQTLAREAQSASDMKSAFLANMSHEVRTPLNGVIGAAEMLRATRLDADQRLFAETIATSAEHLLGVVNQVLDLSKIESGRVEMEDGIVDLLSVSRVVVAMFRKGAEDKGIRLALSIADDVPPHVRGDALRIRQVLANLVSNAVKFTDTGEVAIEVGTAGSPDRGRRLRIRVSDTGIGIAEEARARIFDAFAQSDVSDARRYGGTGLGLTISRRLVRLMDGELDLESRVGEGTVAVVDLPLRPVTLFSPAAIEAAPELPSAPSAIRVLIADDNATNRMLLARMLAPLVAELRDADDGASAVAAWRQGGVDLILMDIQMPGMTGVEAAAAIRAAEREEGRAPVPIYSISANAMPHQIDAYRMAGMNGHLSKPFRKIDLAEIVARHLPPAPGAAGAGQPGARSAQPAKTFSSATTT